MAFWAVPAFVVSFPAWLDIQQTCSIYKQGGCFLSTPRSPDLHEEAPLRSAGGSVCTRKGKIPGFKEYKAAALALALPVHGNTGSALLFFYLSMFWGCSSFPSISSKGPVIIAADILTF